MNDWLDAELRTWTDLRCRKCVLVDGDNGVGKSVYVAPKIAGVLKAKMVSVDDFLLKSGAPYLDQIKYDGLRAEILKNSPVVVEGLCMIKVMTRIGVTFDYHVFVRRLNQFGWENAMWLKKGAKEPQTKITRDLVRYYKECEPFGKCDRLLEVNPWDLIGK